MESQGLYEAEQGEQAVGQEEPMNQPEHLEQEENRAEMAVSWLSGGN